MDEPKRPPPPKSYVPLSFLDGPPEMPPRPKLEGGEASLPPRPSNHSEGQQQDSPVPLRPERRRTKKLSTSSAIDKDTPAKDGEIKENNVDTTVPDSNSPVPTRPPRRQTLTKDFKPKPKERNKATSAATHTSVDTTHEKPPHQHSVPPLRPPPSKQAPPPPPSRPARPPIALTPKTSPSPSSSPSHTRAKDTSKPHLSRTSSSPLGTDKKGTKPDIAAVSVQPLAGDTIPSSTQTLPPQASGTKKRSRQGPPPKPPPYSSKKLPENSTKTEARSKTLPPPTVSPRHSPPTSRKAPATATLKEPQTKIIPKTPPPSRKPPPSPHEKIQVPGPNNYDDDVSPYETTDIVRHKLLLDESQPVANTPSARKPPPPPVSGPSTSKAEAEIAKMIEQKLQELGPPPTEEPPKPPVEEGAEPRHEMTAVKIHPSTEKHQPATSTPIARPSPPKPRKADNQLEAEKKPEMVPRKEPTLDEASKSGRPRPPPPRPRQLDQPSLEKLSATVVDGDEPGAKLPSQEQARRETVPSSERSPREDEVKTRPPRPVPVPPGDKPRPPPPRPRQPKEAPEKPTAKEETIAKESVETPSEDITSNASEKPSRPVPVPPGDKPRPPPPRPRQPKEEPEKPTAKEQIIPKESVEIPSEDIASKASEKPSRPVPVPPGDKPRPPPPRPRQPKEEPEKPTAKEETIAKESIETPSEDVVSKASEKPSRPVPVPPGDRPRPSPPRPRQPKEEPEKPTAKEETIAKESIETPSEDVVSKASETPPRPVPVPPGDRPRPSPPRPRQPKEEPEKPTAKEEIIAKESIETPSEDIASKASETPPRPVPVPPGDRPRPSPPRPRQPKEEPEKPTAKEEIIPKESIETPSEDIASKASETPPRPVPVPPGDKPRPPPPRPRQPKEEPEKPTAKEEIIPKESIETPSEDKASKASEKPPRPVTVPPGDKPRPPPPRPRQPKEEPEKPTAKEEIIPKESIETPSEDIASKASEKPPRPVPVPPGDKPRPPPPRPRQPKEEPEKPTAKEETIPKESIETPSEDIASKTSENPPRPVTVPPGDKPRPPPPRPRQPKEEQPSLEKPAEVKNEPTPQEAPSTKHASKEEGDLVTLQTSEQPSSPKAEHKHPKRPAHRPTRPPPIIRRQQPPHEVSIAGEIPSEAVPKEKPISELQEVPSKQEPLPNKEDAGHEHPPSESEVKLQPPRPVAIRDSPPAERKHPKKPTHRPARPPSIIRKQQVKTGPDIEPERSIPQEPLAPSTQDLQKTDNESLPINEQTSTTPAEQKQKPPRPAVATLPSGPKATRPTQRPSRPPSIIRRQHSAQDHQLEHKTLPVVEASDEKEQASAKIEKTIEETKGDISTHEPAAATEGPPKPKPPRPVAKAPLRHSQSLGQKPTRPPSIVGEQHHAAPGLEDESVIKTPQESECARQETPPTERKQKPPRPVSVAPKKQPAPVARELQSTEEQLQAEGITEAGHTQEPSEGITDVESTSQPTEGITDVESTSQPTEGITDVGSTSQPTEGITDAGPTQPSEGIAETGPIPQPPEGITDAGPTPQPSEGITDAEPTPQASEGSTEAGPTPQPSEGITDAEPIPQPVEEQERDYSPEEPTGQDVGMKQDSRPEGEQPSLVIEPATPTTKEPSKPSPFPKHQPRKSPPPLRESSPVPRKRKTSPVGRRKASGDSDIEQPTVRVIRHAEKSSESIETGQLRGTETEVTEPTHPEVRLRRAPDGDSLRGKDKPPRPLSMPPGKPPKPHPPTQKPERPPSLIMDHKRPAAPVRPRPPRPAPAGPPRPHHPATHKPTDRRVQHEPKAPGEPPTLPPRPVPGHPLYRYVCAVPHGIAKTNNEATHLEELTYEEGDVLELVEHIDENWYYARNADNGLQEGMVRKRDLKIVMRLPGEDVISGFEEGPCAVATHDFIGQNLDELGFSAGDLIMLLSRVDDQWLRGRLVSGGEGIFPKSYVEIVEDLPPEEITPSRPYTVAEPTVEIRGPYCVARHPFSAEGPDELTIAPGEKIELLERVGSEWYKGKLGRREGIFPAHFVEIKVDLPEAVEGDVARAVFDFIGQQGELTFKVNDRIKVLAKVNDEWLKGECGGQTGIFPANFIDKVPDNLPIVESETHSEGKDTTDSKPVAPVTTGKCEALYDFTGENSGELTFKTGDIIITSEWVGEEWMSGQVGEMEGIFPLTYVKVLKELPKQERAETAALVPKTTHLTDDLTPKAVAIHDYKASSDEEISFQKGDVLYLLDRVGQDWYMGENPASGQIGEFPNSFVNVIVPLP